jgi:hypothetical protein
LKNTPPLRNPWFVRSRRRAAQQWRALYRTSPYAGATDYQAEGLSHPVIDGIVALADSRLAANRKKAA